MGHKIRESGRGKIMKHKKQINKGNELRRIVLVISLICVFTVFFGTAFAGKPYYPWSNQGPYNSPPGQPIHDGNPHNELTTFPVVTPFTMSSDRLETPNWEGNETIKY